MLAAYATCDDYPHNAYPGRFLNFKIYLLFGVHAGIILYSWLCIPGFIFQVSDYWFYIPGFIFQDWECFGGLGLASRPRLGLLYIPGFIFLVLYSWFYIPCFIFLVSDFEFQIASEAGGTS